MILKWVIIIIATQSTIGNIAMGSRNFMGINFVLTTL